MMIAAVMILSCVSAEVFAADHETLRAPEAGDHVSGAAELEAAVNAGLSEITLAGDFEIDRTIYVTQDVTIRADEGRQLTRAADFTGDLFVVGESSTGEASAQPVRFVLGEAGGPSITVDGNRNGMDEDAAVNGSALFVANDAQVEISNSVTFANHKKEGNVRTLYAQYGLSSADSVGGAAIVAASGSVTVSGARFENNESAGEGGAVYFAADSEGVIEDAVFSANASSGEEKGSGGALALRSASVVVRRTSFIDNQAARHGGAIYEGYTTASGHGGELTLEDCAFNGNTSAYHGGAVYVTSSALDAEEGNLTARDTSFTNNSARNNGGALYISDSNVYCEDAAFVGNAAATAGEGNGGGAIYSSGGLLDVNGASFTGNGSGVNGGAIGLYSSSQAKLNNINAEGNTAQSNGGFLYNSGSDCRVYGSEIKENSAVKNGGAFSLHSQGETGIYNTELVGNEAGSNGGAIYDYTGASETVVHSSTLQDNTAANYGGALFASNASILKVLNSEAEGNSAGSGGVLYETTTGTTVTFNGVTVSGNSAASGPIVYGNTNKAVLNVNAENYTDADHAGDYDSAYWSSAVANKLTLNFLTDEIPGYYDYDGTYVGDSGETPPEAGDHVSGAAELEAAVNAGLSEITLAGDFEIDRTIYVTQDVTIRADEGRQLTRAADFTGDLFVVGESSTGEASAQPVRFVLGEAGGPSITVDGNRNGMDEDAAVNGSALFVANDAQVEISNSVTFANHKKEGNVRTLYAQYGLSSADSVGGAAIVAASGSVTVSGARFENNESAGEGGAVYFAADSEGVIEDAVFSANASSGEEKGSGGALALRSASVVVRRTSFIDNQAARHGGAIYEGYTTASGHGGELTLEDCAFNGNTSAYHGGAVYVTSSALDAEEGNLTARDTSFTNNSARNNGGALYISDSNVYCEDAAFVGNAAATAGEGNGGGAIYSSGGLLDVNGASFTGNGSGVNGGAIGLYSSSQAKLNNINAEGNTAQSNGGFLYNSGSDCRVYGSEIKENSAVKNGGAFSLHSQGETGIYNTELVGNEAGSNGGAIYDYTGASETVVHSSTLQDNTAANYGGALFASNASILKVLNSEAEGNSAGSGGVLYETTTGTTVTFNGVTVSGNSAASGPIVYGNTNKAVLNVNAENYTDADHAGELDSAYWASAVANKLTLNFIDEAIPGYYDYEGRYQGVDTAMEGVVDVRSAAELEAAIEADAPLIRIAADFALDRTFYITSQTTVFSTTTHTLTRAADFAGDLFVVGEKRDGRSEVMQGREAVLNLGDPDSTISNLLIIDGNKSGMQVPVTGSALFVCRSARVNVFENVSFLDHKKTGNRRTAGEDYGLPHTNRIGGAVAVIANGVLSIYGGLFSGNEVNDETDAEDEEAGKDCTLGAVIFNYGNLYVYGGLFTGNQAARGGVIYNYRMARVYAGTFRGNRATHIGGAVYQANSQYAELLLGNTGRANPAVLFENNVSSSVGGAIFSQSKAVILIYGGTAFRGNKSQGSNGGAICAYGTVTAENASFEDNRAYQRGGAIYVSNADDTLTTRLVSLTDVTFTGNSANRGGAIGIFAAESDYSDGGKALLTRCSFAGNTAANPGVGAPDTVYGGAVYVSRKGTLDVADSTFTGNSALMEGGALYAGGESNVTISGTSLENNTTSIAGAGNGGAISVHSAKLTLRGCALNENSTTKNGGALYISYTTSNTRDGEVTLEDTAFGSNSCGNYGAAVYVTSHEAEDSGVELTAERAVFTGNHSPYNGGALYFTGGSDGYLHDCTFSGNTADANPISNGSRYGGGALYITGAEVEINKALFENNHSGYNGGAIGLYSEGRLLLNEATATGNQAGNNGGFLYVNGSELRVYSSSIDGNAAKGGGGVNAYTSADVAVYETSFTGNTATGNGGALYAYTGGTPVLLQNCVLTDNTAEKYGGAVYTSSLSAVSLCDIAARSNSAQQGGLLYETTAGTEVTLNGVAVAGNSAAEAGPIVYGNANSATLYLNKARYADEDAQQTLDDAYWAGAIVNKLNVVEIDGTPGAYEGYSHETDPGQTANPPVLPGSDTIFALAEHSSDDPINSIYSKFPRLDASSNFMSRNTTLFENVNGADVTVDTFVYQPGIPSDNPNFGEGILIYQAMVYKKNHPEEEVSIDISSFRFSVNAAVCINRNSRYFGYMRNLAMNVEYDKYGFVKIAYLLVTAAGMGIHVNLIGQMDAYPIPSNDSLIRFYTHYLDSACESAYAPGCRIRDYLDFHFCYWTSYGEDAATDMMHTKLCAVSAYTDMNGTDHRWAVWTSSANLDGVNNNGTNGNNKVQTGSIVSGHADLYRVSVNYLRLMGAYCAQEDVYLFREIAIQRTREQLALLAEGRGGEIPADEQIVYTGTEQDDVFELYFSPFGTDSDVWDPLGNPYCKFVDKLNQSDGPISFVWNNANFISFPLSTALLEGVSAAFHNNPNPENRLFVYLKGLAERTLVNEYSDLTVGQTIGYKSLNRKIFSDIHNKDLQFSYYENGEPAYVSLLNSLNIHNGSMFYQSNFTLVIKEKTNNESSVYFTLADYTTEGIVSHSYGELLRVEPTETEHGYYYRQCSECGRIITGNEIHRSCDGWIVDQEASGGALGVRHRVCTICGQITDVCEFGTEEPAAVLDKTALKGFVFEDGTRESTGVLPQSAHTLEATVQLPPGVTDRGGVILGNYGSGMSEEINLEVYTEGRVRLFVRSNGGSESCQFDTDIRGYRPVHVAVTVDGTEARLYLDGALAEVKTLCAELPDALSSYRIGSDCRLYNGPYFKGRIYSAALFSDVRSAEEIALDALLVPDNADGLLYSKYFEGAGQESGGKGSIGDVDRTPLTLEAELALSPLVVGRGGIIVGNFSAKANTANQFSFEIYNNGQPRLYYRYGGREYSYLFNTDVRSADRTRLALVIDGAEARLYQDGTLADTKTLEAEIPISTANYKVGGDNRPVNTQYFKGQILSVALLSGVRSAEEIALDAPVAPDTAEGLIYSEYFTGTAQSGDGQSIGSVRRTPRTIEAELTLPPEVTGRGGVIVGNFSAKANTANQFSFEIYNNGQPRLYYRYGGRDYSYLFDTDVRSTEKTRLALVIDGMEARLYQDGALADTKTLEAEVPTDTANYKAGGDNRPGNTQRFKGELHTLALYDDVKAEGALFHNGSAGLMYSEGREAPDEAHLSGEWIVDLAATAGNPGIRHRECTVCGEITEVSQYSLQTQEGLSFDLSEADGMQFTASIGSQAVIPELPAAPKTFEATVEVPKSMSDRAGVVVSNYQTDCADQISFEIYSNGRPRFFMMIGGTKYDLLFSTDVRADRPVHVAVVLEEDAAVLYVDGEQRETLALPAQPDLAVSGFCIGGDRRSGNTQYFKGTIYSVCLFGDVRTAGEITVDRVLATADADGLLYRYYSVD